MRRISRARSLVSGVELWHPAKPLLENRVEFVHCIVIIMHCLPKLFLQRPFCFLKRPSVFKPQNPVPGIFWFARNRFAKLCLESIKYLIYFSGAVERADLTRSTTPGNIIGPTCPP